MTRMPFAGRRAPARSMPPPLAALALLALVTSAACARAAGNGGQAARVAEEPRTLTVDGLALWYRVAGRAAATPPVLFLHGGPGQGSEHFERLVGPTIERALPVVYFDQRGSGRSGRGDPSLYTMDRLVGDIDSLRAALGVARVTLLGHSFGGTLALEYAARHPERVAALVIAAGMWDAPRQSGLRCAHANRVLQATAVRAVGDSAAAAAARAGSCDWMQRLPAAERDSLGNALMFPDPRVLARLDSVEQATGRRNSGELGAALGRAGLGRYRFGAFERLTMPVLVIAGRHDGAAVPEGLRELTERLPNASLVVLEGSGHFVYLDERERFVQEVAGFLRAAGLAPAR